MHSDPIGLKAAINGFSYVAGNLLSFYDSNGLTRTGKGGGKGSQKGCAGCSSTNPVIIDVPNRWGEAVDHATDTEGGNKSKPRAIDRENTDKRRRARMKNCACVPDLDRDEWPPAFLDDLGDPVSVRTIDRSYNRGLGGFIGGKCKKLPNGTWVQFNFNKK